MPATCSNLHLRRPMRLAASVLVFAACAVVARAQIEDAASPQTAAVGPPYALLQYSTLTGSGNTVTATWVPVVTSTGATYKNITLLFEVSSTGVLTIAPGYPQVVAVTPPVISAFKAGRYVGPSTIYGGEMIINVSGPGVTSGGATEWSLAAGSGAHVDTYPGSATWYVGPLTSNPLYPRLKAAGITSTAWYYGVGGSNYGNPWYTNALMGFSQIGNTLTIVSFTNDGTDYNTPRDTITYTLAP